MVQPTIREYESVTAYTIGATTTPPTPGSGATFYRRTDQTGSYAIVRWEFSQAAVGSAGSGTYILPLPSGVTIDTTRLNRVAAGNQPFTTTLLSNGNMQAAAANYELAAYYSPVIGTGGVGITITNDTTVAGTSWSSVAASFGNNPLNFSVEVRIPVVEFVLTAYTAYGAGLATATTPGLSRATAQLSKVRVTAANGYGSINSNIRRFTTSLEIVGTDIVYADSSTAGGTFTIANGGIYSISYTDFFSAISSMGISRNTASAATNIVSIAAAERIALGTTPGTNLSTNIGLTLYLAAGDIVRAHTDATSSGASASLASFTIQKIL